MAIAPCTAGANPAHGANLYRPCSHAHTNSTCTDAHALARALGPASCAHARQHASAAAGAMAVERQAAAPAVCGSCRRRRASALCVHVTMASPERSRLAEVCQPCQRPGGTHTACVCLCMWICQYTLLLYGPTEAFKHSASGQNDAADVIEHCRCCAVLRHVKLLPSVRSGLWLCTCGCSCMGLIPVNQERMRCCRCSG